MGPYRKPIEYEAACPAGHVHPANDDGMYCIKGDCEPFAAVRDPRALITKREKRS